MAAWLRVFLPLATLAGGLYLAVVHYETRTERQAFEARQQTRLQLAEKHLAAALLSAATDLRVLSATPGLQRFLTGAADGREFVEGLFVAFVGENPHYQQLRLIDAQGIEVVRVQRTAEGARIVPVPELQSKQGRDYVVETLKLLPGLVRVSRFDLNVERGVIEVPHRPVLRLSTRIHREGRPDYLLVVNLRGDVLLQGLLELADAPGTQTWLLDDEGYWVLHPDPRLTWGRQLDPRLRIDLRLPALAEQLDRGSGSVQLGDTVYVHRRLHLLGTLSASDNPLQSPDYDLVSVAGAGLYAGPSQGGLRLVLGIVVLGLALISALLARQRTRADAAERRAMQLQREQALAGEARAWIRDRSYELSLDIHATDDPVASARAVLARLAQALDLAAACLYRVVDDRATGLGSWGLGDAVAPRAFDRGQGLVGEVLRTGEERVLRPPPAGYLDLHGGLGRAAPAEIRILPLAVHGRLVGILELALSRALDPREEELLRSVQPLVALNLDGFLGRPAR